MKPFLFIAVLLMTGCGQSPENTRQDNVGEAPEGFFYAAPDSYTVDTCNVVTEITPLRNVRYLVFSDNIYQCTTIRHRITN